MFDRLVRNKLIIVMIFLLGAAIMLYPVVSQYYYEIEANNEVKKFESTKMSIGEIEIEKRMELAKSYNETLDPSLIYDPFNPKYEKGRAEYARMLEVHEKVGHIDVPSINQDIPVYAGTAEVVLQKGAGHLEGTSLPIGGESTHSVITAHRGLPTAKLFTDLNKIKIDDIFYMHNIKEVLAYKVDQILTVEPDDFEHVLVSPGEDYMTLLTCTPYMVNSHRLLVRGTRIDYTKAVEEMELEHPNQIDFKSLFYMALVALVIVLSITFIYIIFRKKNNKI